MSYRVHVPRVALRLGVVLASLGVPLACGRGAAHQGAPTANGGSGGADSSAEASGAGGTDVSVDTPCDGSTVPEAKRIVRLSFNQISSTIRALFGDALSQQIDADYEIGPGSQVARTFPPLASPREGSVIGKMIWPLNDQIAAAAGAYTLANLDAVTACGAAPTEACAQTFVNAFAEKAFRRPLTESEVISVAKIYTEVKGIYGTVPEAIQYTVYALTQAPQVLYRTELGSDPAQAGALTQYELASELSYFLTDGPPDQALLDAAQQRELTTADGIARQVARMLDTPSARTNLENAMFSYFRLDNLLTVTIDDPAFTNGTAEKPYAGVRESAYRESQLFFTNVLWGGPLSALLTAKHSSLNTTLAALYGIVLPTTPADEATFVQVNLPATRGGLLTQAAFLTSTSRPDDASVVGRGLSINAALLCATNPPFPTDGATAAVNAAKALPPTASSREKSEYRTTTEPCRPCHLNFDAYGLALDTYDSIGRYRTMDAQGRVIDPSVTLPANAGGGLAKDAIDMEAQIANAPAFASCMAKNLLNWALAEGTQLTPSSCPAHDVAAGFKASDQTFSALLTEIATSEAFTQRAAGASQ